MAEIGTNITKAASILASGQLVGIPTETVYGLAGNALDENAISAIFKTKERPTFDPLIVHFADIQQVRSTIPDLPEKAIVLVKALWPGPLTLVLPKPEIIPYLATSGLDTVAVRVPSHPLTRQLLEHLAFPLAAPSANPFGYVSPTTARHVQDQLGSRIPYILDGGPCTVGLESTIVGFEQDGPVIYRLGGTRAEDIESLIGTVEVRTHSTSDPRSPGMLASHYAPGRTVIIGDIAHNLDVYGPEGTAIISLQTRYPDVPDNRQCVLSVSGELDEAARNLFRALRDLDRPGIERILTEEVPDHGLGRAINDRLRRAAAQKKDTE